MAGPKQEWHAWDRRFQLGYSCLNQRLKNNEEATHKITQLEQVTAHLTGSSKHLQEANDSLKDRIQKLEQTSHRITQLDEQIQDLTASSRSLKEENNVLNDRILQLEQECSRRDRDIGAVEDRLTEKLRLHVDEFKGVVAAMRGMNEIARAERERRGEEIQQLRSQVGILVATRHTHEGHTRDASRGISEATTEDDWMPINQPAKQQQQQQPNGFHHGIEVQGVLIKAQGPFTPFEDHLRYAEKAFKQYEVEVVQAFVTGVQEEYRVPLGNKLDEHGEWTWQAAREEGYRIIDTEKKAKRRSARLMAASSQLS